MCIRDRAHTAPRVAIMHAGGLAPGMNTAARAAVRLGIDAGLEMVGVYGSFKGLLDGDIRPLSWGDADGWVGDGGAELGTRREVPTLEQLYAIGRAIEKHEIAALLIIGGYDAYDAAAGLVRERDRYPAFNLPTVSYTHLDVYKRQAGACSCGQCPAPSMGRQS